VIGSVAARASARPAVKPRLRRRVAAVADDREDAETMFHMPPAPSPALSRRLLVAGALAAPFAALAGCATGGGGGPEEALRRLLGISTERAFARLASGGGLLDDPAALLAPPRVGAGAGGDRGAAVLRALLRSVPVRRELALVVDRAAGAAADRAEPLIRDAVRSMRFADALAVARGGPTAATDYLERFAGDRVLGAMLPEVADVLDGLGGGSVLGPVLGAATGVDVVGLQRVVATQAARALWRAVGREEAAIRADPARAGDPLVAALLGSGPGRAR